MVRPVVAMPASITINAIITFAGAAAIK